MTAEERYREYRVRFAAYSDVELVDAFNREVGNPGWTSSRGAYLRALHDEFVERGFDLTDIGGAEEMSLGSRIKLRGKKKIVADEKYAGPRGGTVIFISPVDESTLPNPGPRSRGKKRRRQKRST